MKKIGLWLVVLSMIMSLLPGTMVSAADADWIHVEAETGMGITQHSPEGYGASGNCALVGHNHDGGGANLNGSNSITVTVPADGEYDVFAIVGKGDVNDPGNSRGTYKFSIGDEIFFESGVGTAIAPISESFKQVSLGVDTYAQRLYWINAGTVSLSEGEVTLNLEIVKQGLIDCLRFVPAEWGWEPTGANLDDPEDMSGQESEDDTITTEWFDIEVEDGTYEGTLLTKTDNDRKYFYTVQGTNSAKSTTSIFTLEEEATYDIWAVVGVKENANYLASYAFELNGDEFYKKDIKASFAESTGDTIFTSAQPVAAGNNLAMKWVKIASDKVVPIGSSMLTATIAKAEATENKLGIIDVVRFVPSEWEWVPESNFDDPYDMSSEVDDPIVPGPDDTTEWIHIEAEDNVTNSYLIIEKDNASNGKYYTSGHGNHANGGSQVVTIPETKAYDVWAAIGVPYNDEQSNLRGGYEFSFDDEEPFYKKYNAQVEPANGEEFFREQLFADTYGMKSQWVKIGENISLTAGDVAFNYTVIYGIDGSDRGIGMMDCFRIVPAEWEWVPSGANFDDPEDMSEERAEINTPNEDGALMLEAECGTISGAMRMESNNKASAGAYVSVKSTQSTGSVELVFSTLEEETYDIWAAVATNPVNWLGGYVFTLNGTEIYNKCLAAVDTSNPDLYGEKIVLHTGNSAQSGGTMRWVKVGESQTIAAGDHTIVAGTRQGKGSPNGTGIIDCIAFVPSAWRWRGSDELALPEKPDVIPDDDYEEPIDPPEVITTEAFSIEVENGEAETGTIFVGTFGDRKVLQTTQGNSGAAKATTSNFTLDEEGTYDIWAVVGTHSGGNNLSSYKFTLDGTAYPSISAGSPTYDAEGILYHGPTVASGYTTTMVWARVAEDVMVTAGDHELLAEIKQASANTNRLGAIDCVTFIPSDWNLKGSGSLSKQIAEGVKAKYFTGDYSAITEDIELPEALPEIAGITITFECDDADVIAADGTVTRPFFNEEDANVNFNVAANFGNGAIKAPIPMTVLKNAKYSTANVSVTEEVVAGGAFEASADVVVNAAADSGISGKASLVIALYNADGSLADITMDGASVTYTGASLDASITLPEDLSGKYIKVYLMNGFEMGNQLVETIAAN